jgi:hypothetical protein
MGKTHRYDENDIEDNFRTDRRHDRRRHPQDHQRRLNRDNRRAETNDDSDYEEMY